MGRNIIVRSRRNHLICIQNMFSLRSHTLIPPTGLHPTSTMRPRRAVGDGRLARGQRLKLNRSPDVEPALVDSGGVVLGWEEILDIDFCSSWRLSPYRTVTSPLVKYERGLWIFSSVTILLYIIVQSRYQKNRFTLENIVLN